MSSLSPPPPPPPPSYSQVDNENKSPPQSQFQQPPTHTFNREYLHNSFNKDNHNQ